MWKNRMPATQAAAQFRPHAILVRSRIRCLTAAMANRKVFVALLLVISAIGFWYLRKRNAPPPAPTVTPAKIEAEERTKANPFPAPEAVPEGKPK